MEKTKNSVLSSTNHRTINVGATIDVLCPGYDRDLLGNSRSPACPHPVCLLVHLDILYAGNVYKPLSLKATILSSRETKGNGSNEMAFLSPATQKAVLVHKLGEGERMNGG